MTFVHYKTVCTYGSDCYNKDLFSVSRLLAVSLARQCQLLPDDSAGLDTPAGLAGLAI